MHLKKHYNKKMIFKSKNILNKILKYQNWIIEKFKLKIKIDCRNQKQFPTCLQCLLV